MKKVNKVQYYNSFKNKNAIHHVDTSTKPYGSFWTMRHSDVVIAKEVFNKQTEETEYFILE